MSHIPQDQLSFPYPEIGGDIRQAGEGCTSCVHQTYCPALYWFRRYTQKQPDDHNGIQCLSWSNSCGVGYSFNGYGQFGYGGCDQVKEITQADLDKNEDLNDQGILEEANRNGFTDPVTASNRDRAIYRDV